MAHHQNSLTATQQTLLLTLYAKALDARSPRSILHDTKADEILRSLGTDYGSLNKWGNNSLIVVRARQYDEWIRDYLKKNPSAVVVNLGCGLDTRIQRITPSKNVTWLDVDFPEDIELRRRFFSEKTGYTMMSSALTDPAWLDAVPTGRPTLLIAEGVREYLTQEDVKTLFDRIIARFGHGELYFDIMSAFAIKGAGRQHHDEHGPIHKWAVDDIRELNRLFPRLTLVHSVSLARIPFVRKLPFAQAALYSLMSLVPKFRNMMRLARAHF